MKSVAENKLFSTNKTLNFNGRLVDLTRPAVMGIINVTPDSFYQGSRSLEDTAVLKIADKMLTAGATFLDVGGYSTRPGATDVAVGEEIGRVTGALRAILRQFPNAMISVDTFRSEVAKAAVNEGAGMINDVSGGSIDPDMFATVSRLGVPYVLMHMRGNPQNMTSLTNYDNMMQDVMTYFHQKTHALNQLYVKDIIIDPGFGFAKTADQNFQLLNHLEDFAVLEKPLMIGLSRKSMIWRTLNITPEDALNGTSVLNTVALMRGANILRVHDVREAVEAVQLVDALSTHR